MKLLRFLVLGAMLAAVAAASTTYTASLSSQTTASVSGGTHGLGCKTYSVTVYSGSAQYAKSRYTYSIDAGNYNFVLTLNTGEAAITGSVKLQGCFSVTNASTDWQLTGGSGSYTVCSSCTDNAYADRLYSSQHFVATKSWSFATSNGGGPDGNVRVWLNPTTQALTVCWTAVYGWGASGTGVTNTLGCADSFPTGAYPIAQAAVSGGVLGAFSDHRP